MLIKLGQMIDVNMVTQNYDQKVNAKGIFVY